MLTLDVRKNLINLLMILGKKEEATREAKHFADLLEKTLGLRDYEARIARQKLIGFLWVSNRKT